MPKEFSVSLYYRQQINFTTGELFRQVYGVLEYLRHVPQYGPELYQLYKYSRLTMVKYDFEIVNLGRTPLEILSGVLPFDEANAASVTQISEKPGTVRKLVSGQGGMDRAKITKKAIA